MMRPHRPLTIAALLAATSACTAMLTPAVTTYPVDAPVDYSQLATMKHGESCAVTYLFFFGPQGRATVAAAAQKAGLTHVRYVDNRYENQYWRQRYCVVAYGQ